MKNSTELKKELIEHLKPLQIVDVGILWFKIKSFYRRKGIESGGSYSSWDTQISVRVLIDAEIHRFTVGLDEVTEK